MRVDYSNSCDHAASSCRRAQPSLDFDELPCDMEASPMADRSFRWLSRLPRIAHAVLEEVEPLLSGIALAQAATVFPQQSFNRTRTALLRAAGVRIGPHSLIQGPVRITGPSNPSRYLSIGAHTIITGPLHADLGARVTIGDWVRIGHDVSLLTVNHAIGTELLRSGVSEFGEIEIGNGAWLASRVTILPKVRIGAGAVVAAGAVVTRNVPPNTLVAGVPARVLRELSADGSEPPPSSRLTRW
jgi:maltose O-acetyltransferase